MLYLILQIQKFRILWSEKLAELQWLQLADQINEGSLKNLRYETGIDTSGTKKCECLKVKLMSVNQTEQEY